MRKTLALPVIAAVCVLGAAFARPAVATKPSGKQAEKPLMADAERYKAATSDSRRKFFEDSMGELAPPAKEAFWATYKDFESEKNEIASARIELLKKFTGGSDDSKAVSDEDITEAVNGLIQLQQEVGDLRLKYFGILSQKIDVKTAGRFALIDDYVTTSLRLEWLNQIPFPGDEKK